MAKLHRFMPKAERLKSEQADGLRQAVFDFGLPEQAEADILVIIQRHEAGGAPNQWSFNMISPAQCLAVWNAIEGVPEPRTTRRVFDYVLTHFETNTGYVTLTREEIAERVGIRANEVSSAMRRLEGIGAVIRERWRVPGMKGPGKAMYRLNPHVAWNGSLEKRAEVAQQTKQVDLPFEVVDGGAA